MRLAMVSWTLSGAMRAAAAAIVGFIRGSFRAGSRSLGIDLDPALFLGGGQDDQRAGLAHPADGVQLLDQQPAERLHVPDADFEKKRELAGDVMALEDLVHVPDGFDETGLELRMFDEYLDERRDVVAQLPLIQEGHVSADDAAALQLP